MRLASESLALRALLRTVLTRCKLSLGICLTEALPLLSTFSCFIILHTYASIQSKAMYTFLPVTFKECIEIVAELFSTSRKVLEAWKR